MQKMWILLSQLANGGLERVQINIATELKNSGVDISIVAGKTFPHYSLQTNSGIPIIEISPSNKLLFPCSLIKRILQDNPTTIMTTSNDIACITILINLFFKKKINLIISHHLSLSEPIRKAPIIKKLKLLAIKQIMKLLYPYANSIIAVSRGVADDIAKTLAFPQHKIHVIYNPIITKDFNLKINDEPPPLSCFTNGRPTIIFVGRISPEKRLDIILSAASKVSHILPINLLIVGDGSSLNWTKKQIAENDIEDISFITSFVENPLPLIRNSQVLILASDYEGFGNVLVEAMACKTQVISTDCPYGPSEILGKGRYGQLIPRNDPDALASAILKSLNRSFYIEENILSLRAMEFTTENAMEKYIPLINPDI